jgi:flagellar hook-associated protein 1 FlgK
MSSIGSILNIARSAMQAHQVALQTVSQNIANAGVEGYSRQEVRVAAQVPQLFPYGNLGTGVVVQGVTRSRDALLDTQFRSAAGSASNFGRTTDIATRIEQVLGEPSGSGLGNAMDAFWNSWSDLANDPTSTSARGVVRQRGTELGGLFTGMAAQLDSVNADTRANVASDIGRVNEIAKQIADINPSIVASETNNRSANDLRDTRDRLVDELSKLTSSQTIEHTDGSIAVYVSGRLLVDDTSYHQLALRGGSSPVSIVFKGETDGINQIGGSIGAGVDGINVRIPTAMKRLDALAGTIVRETNAIHATGTVFTGTPPVGAQAGNFFDQAGAAGSDDVAQTARGMRLSTNLADLAQIAAASGGAGGIGNNALATRLAGLRDATVTVYDTTGTSVATTTLGGYFRDAVAEAGLDTNEAQSQNAVNETLMNQADARRQSVSGVATDEELVALIKHQQAYAAAARLVSVVDEMSKTLIDLGR